MRCLLRYRENRLALDRNEGRGIVASQEFRKSTAGLVLSVVALALGVIGLITTLLMAELSSSVGFLLITSLGGVLTYMQLRKTQES